MVRDESGKELLWSLGELLAGVEELADDSGAVELTGADGASLGVVMAEKGRICWATASDSPHRLSDRLGRHAGLGPVEMRELMADCRKRGVPLGEHLVERGLIAAEELRTLLLEQVAAALSSLVRRARQEGCDWTPWKPVRSHTYHPDFTFTAGEILNRILHDDVELRLDASLPLAFVDLVDQGVAKTVCLRVFDPAGERVLPALVSPGVEIDLAGARQLYGQAAELLGAATTDESTPYVAFLRREDDIALAVAVAGAWVLVAELEGPAGFSSLVSNLYRWRQEYAEQVGEER